MTGLVDLGRSLLGQEPGITLLLFFLCGLTVWAYWREKTRNDEIQEERIAEAREDTKAMTEAVMEAKGAIQGFKHTLDAIAPHLPRR